MAFILAPLVALLWSKPSNPWKHKHAESMIPYIYTEHTSLACMMTGDDVARQPLNGSTDVYYEIKRHGQRRIHGEMSFASLQSTSVMRSLTFQ
jgi:hypothetical protein